MTRALLLTILLAGCAVAEPEPVGTITLEPMPASSARPAAARVRKPLTIRPALPVSASAEDVPVGSDSPAAVIRDTAALNSQAVAYVAAPNSRPAVIDRLTTLSVASSRSLARLRAGRTRAGYRQGDVVAARVAADALAAYLATQARPLPVPAPAAVAVTP